MLDLDLRQRLGEFRLAARFAAGPGVTALFGRSGSGKTSLLRLVAGLSQPDAGRLVLGGRVLVDREAGIWVPPHRRRIGYVFQEGRLFPHLDVTGNLAYAARVAGRRRPDAAMVARTVDLLGIRPLLARRPRHLSGGEQQRVAIGRALLSDPGLLLLDEPLASLDEARKADLLPWLERLRDGLGLPILLVTHDLAELVQMASHMVLLDNGQVVAQGEVGPLLQQPELAPMLGRFGSGTIIDAVVSAVDPVWGMAHLDSALGPLSLPAGLLAAGAAVRLRVPARDVTLALAPPHGLSARNILPGTIRRLQARGVAEVDVLLAVGRGTLLATLTRQAATDLALADGMPVWALVKATAVG